MLDSSLNEYRLYIFLAAVAAAGLAHVWRLLASPLAKVPGPFYSNFTGNVLKFYWLAGKRASYVYALHKKYGSSLGCFAVLCQQGLTDAVLGPIVRVGPGEVDITDMSSVKETHTVRATYLKDPSFYATFGAPGQETIFATVDAEFHRRHRRLLSNALSETSLKFMHPIIESRVDLTIQRMADEMKSRGCADVFK